MSEYGGSSSSNNYSLDHLHTLLAVNDEAEAERSGIDLAEVSAALSDAADGMLEEIERSIYLAALDSRTMADLFWEEKMERFAAGDPGKLGIRVRVNRGTLEVVYFRDAFVRNSDSMRKGKTYYAKHIKRSGKHHYNARDFKGAESWERELVAAHEKDHAKNRKIFYELSKARTALKEVKKVIESHRK